MPLDALGILSQDVSLKLVYGLGFMFSTLFIASISDLRKMTIKAEFMTMWIGFTGIMLWHDYSTGIEFFWVKWLLILVLGILSWKGTGHIFSLARADVIAITAVCSVLDIPYIVLFYIFLLLVNKIGVFPLKLFGKGEKYPFMPVILLSLFFIILVLGIVEWNEVYSLVKNLPL